MSKQCTECGQRMLELLREAAPLLDCGGFCEPDDVDGCKPCTLRRTIEALLREVDG
jgi:hypothetical protein